MEQEWVRLTQYELPHCKVFVRPGSYCLMDPEERTKKWLEDCAAGRGDAGAWVELWKDLYANGKM